MKNAKNRRLVCLAGKASSGKSMLIDLLKQDGYHTIKLDNLIHEYYQKDRKGYEFILENFGKEYVNEVEVDRKRLGQLVFNNPDKLKLLNEFAEKTVKYELNNLSINGIIVVEGAVIYTAQKNYLDVFDYFVLIERNEELIKESIAQKFAYLKDFDLKKWNPIKDNPDFIADFVVKNNDKITNAYNQLLKFLTKIRSDCEL
ncbi:dephospho-CoA kinase [Mycoplasma sp. E35C]|uniref:dephospho-CoA kinase n=1 Tax=Mycoplasma sp. E35C TaxID=2801918 RepID=UPI001CA3B9E2|nr:dephospho-CoA kinase [Mycoplasma sp. E35C]QZX49344.1 dephospho-CoA kinase [Mycoplasma sp. E35C]